MKISFHYTTQRQKKREQTHLCEVREEEEEEDGRVQRGAKCKEEDEGV